MVESQKPWSDCLGTAAGCYGATQISSVTAEVVARCQTCFTLSYLGISEDVEFEWWGGELIPRCGIVPPTYNLILVVRFSLNTSEVADSLLTG
jgi:hypothetical protein